LYAEIKGFKGYLASSDGNIVRISGKQLIPLQSHGVKNSEKQYVFLMKADGHYAQRAVDKLVLEAFCTPGENKIIRHCNGDMSDCRLENLMWARFKRCEKCAMFGELCKTFIDCKLAAEEKERKERIKPPTQAKIRRSERMADIARKACVIDILLVKVNLRDIVIELRSGDLPDVVYDRLMSKGYTFTLQYVYKIMRLIEKDSKELYAK